MRLGKMSVTRLLAAGLAFTGVAAMAYEEPAFTVMSKQGQFEVRAYQAYTVAEMRLSASFEEAGNQAFMPLFRYISGDNQTKTKIEMTIPVTQQPAGEKIEMTVPVTQQRSGESDYVVAFVLPKRYTAETAPQPKDARVKIRQVAARTVAAWTYTPGFMNDRYLENEALLAKAINDAGLKAVGAPVFARYNDPFTPWFWRRNEVLVDVEQPRS